MATGEDDSSGKAICSICYEYLKPIVEDLQSISICGHVFHELCWQQWFEYSANKKHSCPVCKQKCTAKNVSRLYFQSIGNPSDVNNSSQVLNEEDASLLRLETKRLEIKVYGLNSTLERKVVEIKELNDQLQLCKEQIAKETAMKNEALNQKASIQRLLQSKSEELKKLLLECSGLKERNLDLGKELAALKLITDVNLDEDDALKFASLGNEANNKDTIDVLRKSLVIRNKSYKELMAKCNLLGRGEARYSKLLEKATQKINKLKIRVQELETGIEAKDNNTLRELKTTKKAAQETIHKRTSDTTASPLIKKLFTESQMNPLSTPMNNYDRVGSLNNHPSCHKNNEDINYIIEKDASLTNKSSCTGDVNEEKNAAFLGDGIALTHTKEYVIQKSTQQKPEAVSDINKGFRQGAGKMVPPPGSRTGISSDHDNSAADMDQDVILLSDDGEDVLPAKSNIHQKFTSPPPTTLHSEVCFSGGLLGPDRTNRYLGKWCKRASNPSSGDLIAVGADGRGGRIKVLRTVNQHAFDETRENYFLIIEFCHDGKETSSSSKRCKYGSKTSALQSKGNLQIEHFFGRAKP
ncbi:uncharacterized protein [Rutidosis leptorrhynchoides]|uniref:uncharacterized protein n=1 Tax=Rutidosis leptorrhynchoides TaxID=125765 RepID=UPI003A998F8B